MSSVTAEDWQHVQQTAQPTTTLQIAYYTNIFSRETDVLAAVIAELPEAFAKLKLSVIWRSLHATLNYIDDLTFDEIREINQVVSSTSKEELESYGLLETVELIDFENLKFITYGKVSKFIAIEPHPQFLRWVEGFYSFIKAKLPWIAQRHLAKVHGTELLASNSHISLLQYGEKVKIELTEEEINAAVVKLRELFQRKVRDYSERFGKSPKVYINLFSSPIELVAAPRSRYETPMALISFKLDPQTKTLKAGKVGRFLIRDESSGFSKVVEYSTENFKPVIRNQEKTEASVLNEAMKRFTTISSEDFLAKLSPNVKRIYLIAKKELSPTKQPAYAPTNEAKRKNKFLVAALAHPKIAPEKGFEALEKARELGFNSTASVSIGRVLYASTLREDVSNPSDIDLLINSVVHVPSSIESIEQAKKYAIQKFNEDIFGILKRKIEEKKISLLELRMGSNVTLGKDEITNLDGYEVHKDLSENDFLRGYHIDGDGNKITIEKLISTGDFIKGKVDLFVPSQGKDRTEVSLQFLVAYEWNGSLYTFQYNGLKGVPPFMRTAEYDGEDSYAVSQAVGVAFDYYLIQKGGFLPRAISEVLKTFQGTDKKAPVLTNSLWDPKSNKKYASFIRLLESSGLNLTEIFFNQTKEILIREKRWQDGFSYNQLLSAIENAINPPILGKINHLKRITNDFREFNAGERGHTFSERSMQSRLQELAKVLVEVEEYIQNSKFKKDADFMRSFDHFKNLYAKVQAFKTIDRAIAYVAQPRLYATFLNFEKALKNLEGDIVTDGYQSMVFTEAERAFLQTLVSYVPHFYWNYLLLRSQDSVQKMSWILRFLRIEASDENIQRMNFLADNIHTLSREDFAKEQIKLFSKITPATMNDGCEGLFVAESPISSPEPSSSKM